MNNIGAVMPPSLKEVAEELMKDMKCEKCGRALSHRMNYDIQFRRPHCNGIEGCGWIPDWIEWTAKVKTIVQEMSDEEILQAIIKSYKDNYGWYT